MADADPLMRLSAYPEPGYRLKGGANYRVTMDGRTLERCVRCDTGAGVAWVADTNPDGSLKIDRRRGEVVLRRMLGSVRVEKIEA